MEARSHGGAEKGRAQPKPSAMQLAAQFLVGLLFLVATAAIAAGKSGLPFVYCTAGVLGGATATMAVGLAWLLRAASGREGGTRQFSLALLLFTTTIAAAYFALVGWLAHRLSPGAPMSELLGPVAMVGFLILLLGLPVLWCMGESLVCFANWLNGRRWVRSLLFGHERKSSVSAQISDGTPGSQPEASARDS